MNLADKLEFARKLAEMGVLRDGEGVTAVLRALEPTSPVASPKAPCFTSAYQRAACMLPWGHPGPHDHGPLSEETKPLARDGVCGNTRADGASCMEPFAHGKPCEFHYNPTPYTGTFCPTCGCRGGHLSGCTAFAHFAKEEQKPPARAHLKGCALDTDHTGLCFVPLRPSVESFAAVSDAYAKAEVASAVTLDRDLTPPTLSPRQALGEALACVERARELLFGIASDMSIPNTSRLAALRAAGSADETWCGVTTVNAVLPRSEFP